MKWWINLITLHLLFNLINWRNYEIEQVIFGTTFYKNFYVKLEIFKIAAKNIIMA